MVPHPVSGRAVFLDICATGSWLHLLFSSLKVCWNGFCFWSRNILGYLRDGILTPFIIFFCWNGNSGSFPVVYISSIQFLANPRRLVIRWGWINPPKHGPTISFDTKTISLRFLVHDLQTNKQVPCQTQDKTRDASARHDARGVVWTQG